MSFISLDFIIFWFILLIFYYLPIFRNYQRYILILASLCFFSFYGINSVVLLFVSTIFNGYISYFLIKKKSLIVLRISVLINILLLVFYKYLHFFLDVLLPFHFETSNLFLTVNSLALPVGISFYTFQAISLLFDSYAKSISEKTIIFKEHISNVFLYKTFFPQAVSGPIVKSQDFFPQIIQKQFSLINFEKVFKYLIAGMFFKMFVANNLKDYTVWMEYPFFHLYSSLNLISMVFGFSFQIFADFAGYSFLALGLASSLGYELKENFNYPYLSTSLTEFWSKWHISLGSFFREYLYFRIGTKDSKPSKKYFNIFLIMLLGGLWHGARLSFILWGLYHAILLIIEKIVLKKSKRGRCWNFLFVFFLVTMGWILFKLQNFSEVIMFFESLFKNLNIPIVKSNVFFIFIYCSPVIIFHIHHKIISKFPQYELWFCDKDWVVYVIMLALVIFNSGTSAEFVYFQF